MRPSHHASRGFTLIELMVVVGLVVVLVSLAAPSLKRMIDVQRVNSTNAQLITDMQFARSEAVTRNQLVRVTFKQNAGMSCYSIYTYRLNTDSCDCLQPTACTSADTVEIRTVRVPSDTGVVVRTPLGQPAEFAFEPVTGALYKIPTDFYTPPLNQFVVNTRIDVERAIRTTIALSGRPTVCAPTGSKMQATAC
jgi:type IV fimbrial biogenesis protein FimT